MEADGALYLRTLLALIFVIGLIFLLAATIKKMGLDKRLMGSKGAASQLSVVETLYLDQKHRLVIIRRKEKEHLLLLGTAGDVLIESYESDKTNA